MNIIKISLSKYPELILDEYEIKSNKPSYTFDTIMYLKKKYPRKTICMIVGLDSFCQIKKWKNWQYIIKLVNIMVINRPKYKIQLPENIKMIKSFYHLKQKPYGLIYFCNKLNIGISSIEIREKIKQNKSIKKFVPKTIINYLQNDTNHYT